MIHHVAQHDDRNGDGNNCGELNAVRNHPAEMNTPGARPPEG
jgi:hypothetical protein